MSTSGDFGIKTICLSRCIYVCAIAAAIEHLVSNVTSWSETATYIYMCS
jgi:hypothetical protein